MIRFWTCLLTILATKSSLFDIAHRYENTLVFSSQNQNANCLALIIGKCDLDKIEKLRSSFFHVIVANDALQDLHGATLCKRPLVMKKNDIPHEITFKELVFEYSLSSHPIRYICVQLEWISDAILDEMLHFAYHNFCTVELSGLTPLSNKPLLNFFNQEKLPCGSLLLKPNPFSARLLKNDIPAVIIGYNQLSYIQNMVKQLEKYTQDIVIIDNCSDYPPLLEYYEKQYPYTLLRQKENHGHLVYLQKSIQNLVGDHYLLTDPDLLFNPQLPERFIEELIAISDYFHAQQVGFALLIDADDLREDLIFAGHNIRSWESQMWKERVDSPSFLHLELYRAKIDTTFCLINRKYKEGSIRVAGNYTCMHMPWHTRFEHVMSPEELDFYLKHNISSCWLRGCKLP